jgi:hypothetical protein
MSFDRFSQPVNICPRCRQEYIDCDCQAGDIEAARRVIGQRHKLAARHEVWAALFTGALLRVLRRPPILGVLK